MGDVRWASCVGRSALGVRPSGLTQECPGAYLLIYAQPGRTGAPVPPFTHKRDVRLCYAIRHPQHNAWAQAGTRARNVRRWKCGLYEEYIARARVRTKGIFYICCALQLWRTVARDVWVFGRGICAVLLSLAFFCRGTHNLR